MAGACRDVVVQFTLWSCDIKSSKAELPLVLSVIVNGRLRPCSYYTRAGVGTISRFTSENCLVRRVLSRSQMLSSALRVNRRSYYAQSGKAELRESPYSNGKFFAIRLDLSNV